MGDQAYVIPNTKMPPISESVPPLTSGLFEKIGKEGNNSDYTKENRNLTLKDKEALVKYGKENGFEKDYFKKIDKAKTWGDVKQVFKDLSLSFETFTKWIENEIRKLALDKNGGFIGPPKRDGGQKELAQSTVALTDDLVNKRPTKKRILDSIKQQKTPGQEQAEEHS